MVEPITLAALGTVALTEGVKFLFDQASETLRRFRDRRDQAQPVEVPVPVEPPKVLAGRLERGSVDEAALERNAETLAELSEILAGYAFGLRPVREDDRRLLEAAGALRSLLEIVYHQRISFEGEGRQQSGPIATGDVKADVVERGARASAVRVRQMRSGTAYGTATYGTVSGEASAVDIDSMG